MPSLKRRFGTVNMLATINVARILCPSKKNTTPQCGSSYDPLALKFTAEVAGTKRLSVGFGPNYDILNFQKT